MVKCQACGGTYEATQKDGTLYFHRCPPFSSAELRAKIAANASPLSAAQAAQLAAIDAAAKVTADDPEGHAPGDAYLSRLSLERANLRDDNVDLAKLRTYQKANPTVKPIDVPPDAIAKAVGAGVVEI